MLNVSDLRNELVISDDIVITDKEFIVEEIERLSGIKADMECIKNNILLNEYRKFYFNESLKKRSRNDKDVSILWLDTGIKMESHNNYPIMIALTYKQGYFSGYFVGTPDYLVNGMCNKCKNNNQKKSLQSGLKKFLDEYGISNEPNKKNEPEKNEVIQKITVEKPNIFEEKKLSKVTNEIFEQLLFPTWKSINGLDRFIKIIGVRVNQLINQGKSEYYMANEIKSVVVNTGMMNKFGNDILIFYRYNEKYQTYIAESLINSKQDFLDNGYTKEQASMEIKSINFFDDGMESFNPTKDDLDVSYNSLLHIVQERKDRFPESIRCKSDFEIVHKLNKALELGIKMQQRDSSFAKASYSCKEKKISWFLPLHIDTNIGEKPELVMAIRKVGEFYELKTILPYDEEIQDRITALSLYNKVWC